jgi:DNA-binding MarR family transcriptional regulator
MTESLEQIASTRLHPWMYFLRAHAVIVRELSADLVREHDLTINDYEVLLFLSHAPERRMRRVDLAASVVVTASGIPRIVQGLEPDGLVSSVTCVDDSRVSYACLTDEGLERFRAARETHLEGVERLFLGRFEDAEREQLAGLLGRLPGNEPELFA